MSEVQQLYRLQQYDSEILEKKRRLAEVVRLQRETEELLAARQRAAKAEAQVARWTAEQTDLNLELGTVNSKAKRSEQRLYSGEVSNPKELEDLQHEVEALGRRRSVLEDELLEAMIMLEEAQEELDGARQALGEVETAWGRSQEALRAEQDQLAAALHALIAEREAHQARIDPEAVAEYEALRTRKNNIAVVTLLNGTCMGCHVSVSANMVLRAERGERITCDGCGRLLYMQ